MEMLLRFLGYMCYFGAALCVLFWAMGDANLLLMAPSLFISGVVFFSLGTILGHVSRIELILKTSQIGPTDRVKTSLGDFEKLGHVEGEAMCTGCRRTVPKADLYYNKAMDVYYHPECLSRDRAG